MSKNTLKLPASQRPLISRKEEEIFDESGQRQYKMWKRGQVTNPDWLDRQNGSDFISIRNASTLVDLEKYLACDDQRLCVEAYNLYSTGHDKAGNRIIFLYDQDENGDNKKIAIIVILTRELGMSVVELVEQYCGESHDIGQE